MLANRVVVSYLLLRTNDSYKNRGTKIECNMKDSDEPVLDKTYAGPTMGGMIVNLLSRYPTRSAFVNPDATSLMSGRDRVLVTSKSSGLACVC